MSILAWAAVVLVVWLAVGILVGIPIGAFIHAGTGRPLESSPEAAAQADYSTLRVVRGEYTIAATGKQIASGV
jgi:hypothetical protein